MALKQRVTPLAHRAVPSSHCSTGLLPNFLVPWTIEGIADHRNGRLLLERVPLEWQT
jgi:hypothetical protein